MARSAPTPCRHPGCREVVETPGYCPKHQQDRRQWDNKRLVAKRQARRAFKGSDPRWRKLRALVLSEEPLCRHCLVKGRITAATVVDHIDGDAFNNVRDNLQPLCARCHNRKTLLFDGGFGRPRRQE